MPDVMERISKQRCRSSRNRRSAGAGSDWSILSSDCCAAGDGSASELPPRALAAIFASMAVRKRGIDDNPVRYASSSPPRIGRNAPGYGDMAAAAAPPTKRSRFHGYRNACLTYEPSFASVGTLGAISVELRRSRTRSGSLIPRTRRGLERLDHVANAEHDLHE